MKVLITGISGIGKTSQIRSLIDAGKRVLVIDGEAGLLSVDDLDFSSIHVRDVAVDFGTSAWQICRHLAVLLTGANPSVAADDIYSHAHYGMARSMLGDDIFDDFDVVFWDSITEFCRDSLIWSQQQDEVITKQGAIDKRAVYGLVGQQMVNFIRQVQHGKKDIVMIGGLKEKIDESGESSYSLLLEGSKSGVELPYIFDEVLTMIADENEKRFFITSASNSRGYPAKDRSGNLQAIEPADLNNVINKIKDKK
ncbi:conserved hypothetical protein [Photobacterium profundum SS9]|uniref:AAA domain-containing protein n=1 Tax=Photobacterium profundum (strain SS9) TaxID=298386 RepID=Q6LHC0_PHOPR|nr:conserved hypothetical protein [Photobacterium profundum SS9]